MIYRSKRNWKRNCVVRGKCWEWKHDREKAGYGLVWTNGKMERAHRLAYRLFKGKVRNQVLHICDNRLCVRPKHLYDGTQSENVKDSWVRHPRREKRRAAVSKQSKRLHRNPNFAAAHKLRMSKAMKKLNKNPIFAAALSKRMKKYWADKRKARAV